MNQENVTQNPPQKNYCLLFFETIACILIVFIHCQFPGRVGDCINGLARFGVPLFFVVSGFFLIKQEMTIEQLRSKLRNRLKRIASLLVLSSSIYFTIGLIQSLFSAEEGAVSTYFAHYYNWKNLLSLLLLNNPLTNVINWFMLAMIISYIFIYLFSRPFCPLVGILLKKSVM